MNKSEFEQLHKECSKSLREYMTAATDLCKLLGEYVNRQASLQELSGDRIRVRITRLADIVNKNFHGSYSTAKYQVAKNIAKLYCFR